MAPARRNISDGRRYMNDILEFVPKSEVRDGIKFARGMLEDSTLQEAVGVLGNGEQVSAQDTVPFCLWCAAQNLHHFEEAICSPSAGWATAIQRCHRPRHCCGEHRARKTVPKMWARIA
jgi:hypothetical protein